MCLVFYLLEEFFHFLPFALKFHGHFDQLWELGSLPRQVIYKYIGVHEFLETIVEFDCLDNDQKPLEDVCVVGIPRRYQYLCNEFELLDRG